MNKKLLSTLTIIAVISISLLVFGMVYENTLPKIVEEINNASIGAILGAIVTVLLLSQQSASEESKERNVKVFEKKSEKYEEFINKIWEVWDDRKIDLLELSEVVKLLSKDIMLYAKEKTVENIIDSLNKISEFTSNDIIKQKDKETKEVIQKQVYNIVKSLAIDLDLSGSLNDKMLEKLYKLEDNIFPAIEEKLQKQELIQIKDKFIQEIESYLLENTEDLNLSEIKYDDNIYNGCGILMGRINNSNVYFAVWHLNNKNYDKHSIRFYVNKHAPNYAENGYKVSGKGGYYENQTTIKNSVRIFDRRIALNDYGFTKEAIENKGFESIISEIGKFIINYITTAYNLDGKSIVEIINECEPNLQNQ
jgi:hypothetical protein